MGKSSKDITIEQDVILAGDIGGTSARLGVFEVNDGNLRPVLRQTLPSREYASLEEVLEPFIKKT
jgi:glucokinase